MHKRVDFLRSSATPLLAGALAPFILATKASATANLLFPISRPRVRPMSTQPSLTTVRKTISGNATYIDLILNSNKKTFQRVALFSDHYQISTISGQSATHYYTDKFAPNKSYLSPWGSVTLGSNLSGTAKTTDGKYTFTAAFTGTTQAPSITFSCPQLKQTSTIDIVVSHQHVHPNFWGSPGCNQAIYDYIYAVLEILNGWAEMIWGILLLDPLLYWQGVFDYQQGVADEQEAIAQINDNC